VWAVGWAGQCVLDGCWAVVADLSWAEHTSGLGLLSAMCAMQLVPSSMS